MQPKRVGELDARELEEGCSRRSNPYSRFRDREPGSERLQICSKILEVTGRCLESVMSHSRKIPIVRTEIC